jgi:hypothetical protein
MTESDLDPTDQIRETIRNSDSTELPIRTLIARTDLNETEVVRAAEAMDDLEFDHAIGLLRLPETVDGEPQTDGGNSTDDTNRNPIEDLSLSIYVDSEHFEVDITDLLADVSVRADHGAVQLAGYDPNGERLAEALLEGSAETMTAVADQLYDVAGTVRVDDSSGGEPDA